jgi:hypothetical protein
MLFPRATKAIEMRNSVMRSWPSLADDVQKVSHNEVGLAAPNLVEPGWLNATRPMRYGMFRTIE